MESQPQATSMPPPTGEATSLSIVERAIAVFTRPGSAWVGLEKGSRWWFPLLIVTLANVAFAASLWERAMMPAQLEAMEERVASGQMTAGGMEQAETMMRGPVGLALAAVPMLIMTPVIAFLVALVLMFAVGFVLGGKLAFGQAFALSTWAGLIQLPGLLVTGILAWSKQNMNAVHVSLGAFLPEPERSNTPMRIVMGVLDGLGPFQIWWVAVVVIGAATLSGVARQRVAWALGGVYVALVVFFAALGAFLSRGS